MAHRAAAGEAVHQTGDEKQFNAAVESIKKLHELSRNDVRAKQILERLLAVWHKKNPNAKPNEPKK